MMDTRHSSMRFKTVLDKVGRVVCIASALLVCSCKEEMDLKRQIKQVNIDIEEAKTKLDQTAIDYRKATEANRESSKDLAKLGPPSVAAEKVRKLEVEVQALNEKLAAGQAAFEGMKKDMDEYKSKYLNH